MKNTIRAVFFQIFVGVLIFFLSFLINMSDVVRNFMYSNIVFRVILCFVPLYLYYNLGKGMSKKKAKGLDFFTGSVVFLIALILAVIAFVGLGMKLFTSDYFSSMWRLPLDVFLYPQNYICSLMGINHGVAAFVCGAVLPSFIFGLSIKSSRKKMLRLKRMKRMREMRNNRGY